MKTFFCFLSILLTHSLTGQRFANFEVDLLQPEDSAYIGSSLSVNYNLRIKNNGPDTMNKTDTVQVYLILDTDTIYFTEVRTNELIDHLNFTNFLIPPGTEHTITRTIYMPHHKIGEVVDFCMIALPFLAGSHSIRDSLVQDNKSCKRIRVWANPNNLKYTNSEFKTSLYPNPVPSLLFIQTTLEIHQIQIFDCKAQLIYHNVHSVSEIDCSQFPNGLYFIHLSGDSSSEIIRFQVSHEANHY